MYVHTHTMFFASNVKINWHVFIHCIPLVGSAGVMRVQVAQEVPGGVDKGIHCVNFPSSFSPTPEQRKKYAHDMASKTLNPKKCSQVLKATSLYIIIHIKFLVFNRPNKGTVLESRCNIYFWFRYRFIGMWFPNNERRLLPQTWDRSHWPSHVAGLEEKVHVLSNLRWEATQQEADQMARVLPATRHKDNKTIM